MRAAARPRRRNSSARPWCSCSTRESWHAAPRPLRLGYQRFDDRLPLAGFIVNRTAGENHGRGVAAAVERATGLPVLGWLPRQESLQVSERHLGLIPTVESGRWAEFIRAAGDAVEQRLDIYRILQLARQATPLDEPDHMNSQPEPRLMNGARPVVAVASDEAFHFTYEDNLDLLRSAGAEVVFFSPLRDEALPARTAGVILGGGFPEVYAIRLSANREHACGCAHAQRAACPSTPNAGASCI